MSKWLTNFDTRKCLLRFLLEDTVSPLPDSNPRYWIAWARARCKCILFQVNPIALLVRLNSFEFIVELVWFLVVSLAISHRFEYQWVYVGSVCMYTCNMFMPPNTDQDRCKDTEISILSAGFAPAMGEIQYEVWWLSPDQRKLPHPLVIVLKMLKNGHLKMCQSLCMYICVCVYIYIYYITLCMPDYVCI